VIYSAQGIIEHEDGSANDWRGLKPTLAYLGEQLFLDDAIEVKPSEADGFGGKFSINLYGTPPEDWYIPFEGHPEWGRTSIALLAATPAHHPDVVYKRSTLDDLTTTCAEDPALCTTCESDELERTVTYGYKGATYEETLCCSEYESADDACTSHGGTGDPSIKDQPALPVTALVPDYFLIYLEKEAPAGSEFAEYVFHSSAGLSPGYHLVHVVLREPADPSMEPYVYSVAPIDEPVALTFKRGATPLGINL
jgi:hypothetical protein